MSQTLAVWFDQRRVATLDLGNGTEWRLQYDAAWVEGRGFPISPNLPVQLSPFQDTRNRRSVRWFFENLLPEEGVRTQIARRLSIRNEDSWTLLTHLGAEVAGALCILPEGETPSVADELAVLDPHDLEARIQAAREGKPLLTSGPSTRLSLAGAQEKMGVRLHEDGSLAEPFGSTPSTHILKPGNANPRFPFCPANEWICMQAAARMGLRVPTTHLLRIAERETVYVVERFDRRRVRARVQRLHQVDLCQVLDLPPDHKYEGDSGPDAGELFEALDQTRIPALARRACLRWFVFNYLTGNDDAHAKNVTFLMHQGHLEVAPFYDLLCVLAYLPQGKPAMTIGGIAEPGQVRREEWRQFAQDTRLDARLVEAELQDQVERLPAALDATLASDALDDAERSWFRKEALPRIQERLGFVERALRVG